MSYRQISYYTDKPILSKKDICMSYVLKKPMSGHPYTHPTIPLTFYLNKQRYDV